ncbi:MFS transporter [Actinoplanes subtropicus]|uniref:MFS transporter n=1 Tax=Actinoplanes subtropicus TaxID=543632 RepID=UPI00055575B1|nr:MFS transporter [Actinoplanes subtropicus]
MSQARERRTVVAASIGNLIEAYDLFLYAYLASTLADLFFPAGDRTTALLNTFAIFAVGFAVRPLGGFFFGHIGDRFGRRSALSASILLMGVSTLAIGLLPPYETAGALGAVLLLVCRLGQGFSVGGEYTGANILVLEQAAAGRAGRATSVNLVAGYLGVAAASTTGLLLATVLTPAELAGWGWRLPFLVAGPLALVGLYLRLRLPDTPAFAATGGDRVTFPLAAALRAAKRAMLIYGGWQMMVALGGFLLFGYVSSYLIRVVGLDSAGAYVASLIAVLTAVAGGVAGGRLLDRYPLRPVALAAAAGLAVTVVPGFLLIGRGGVAAAVAGQMIWAVFVGLGAAVSAVLAGVLFPVHLRCTAAAVAYNVSTTVVGGTAPYVSVWLVARSGSPLTPAWYLVIVAVAGLATATLGLRRPAQASPRGAAVTA